MQICAIWYDRFVRGAKRLGSHSGSVKDLRPSLSEPLGKTHKCASSVKAHSRFLSVAGHAGGPAFGARGLRVGAGTADVPVQPPAKARRCPTTRSRCVAHAHSPRIVETPSSRQLPGLPPTAHPPQPARGLWRRIRGAGRSMIGLQLIAESDTWLQHRLQRTRRRTAVASARRGMRRKGGSRHVGVASGDGPTGPMIREHQTASVGERCAYSRASCWVLACIL